jgi:hypothetical protein
MEPHMLDNVHRFGLTAQDQATLLSAIGIFVKQSIAAAVEPHDKRIAELEARIVQLEAKGIEFWGVYQRGASYRRHSIVVQSNTMWIAVSDVEPNQIPGMHEAWVLCDKREEERQRRRATQQRTQTSNTHGR